MKSTKITLLKAALSVLVCLGMAAPASAAVSLHEIPLNPDGYAYEINPDAQGNVWVTDYGHGEVRRINASDGSITAYAVSGGPSDARLDGNGMLWWGDQNTNQVSRMNTADGSVVIWDLPITAQFYGTNLSSDGIWLTDIYGPYLYHLNTSTDVTCTYTLPNDGMSDYLLVSGDYVWLGDYINKRILRLQISNDALYSWALGATSHPAGLALDALGRLWWADKGNGDLGYSGQVSYLDTAPAKDRIYSFSQSGVPYPQSIAIKDGLVWFTSRPSGERSVIGSLDPASAASSYTTPDNGSLDTLTPTCGSPVSPLDAPSVVPSTPAASWSLVSYTELTSATGWKVYQMPLNSSAWGIAVTNTVYVVDNGRQVLARVPLDPTAALSLSAQKQASPTSVPETGGDVTFTFTVTNTSLADTVFITSLADSVFGPLAGDTDCQVGTVLPSMGSCEFSITRWLEGDASGPDHHNIFTVEVEDDAGRTASITAEATVEFTETQNQKIYIPLLLK